MIDKTLVLFILLACNALAGEPPELRQWGQWRGPLGTGVAPFADPPVEWSETKNVRWKVALPGKGHSTPVVWGDRIFLTAAIPFGDPVPPPVGIRPGSHDNMARINRQEFVVIALDRRSGKVLWQKTVHKDLPHEGAHQSASFASNSPVTDGEHVYAFFGSEGLYCLDLEGELKWKVDLGEMHSLHGHGEGASPALHGETLVVNWDHEGQSFIVAFDKKTGKERWRTERDEPSSWSTPLIVEHGGKMQVVVSATHRVRAYDLETGAVIWECGGMSTNVVGTPVAGDGMVFTASSYEKRAMLAIRLEGARGDITGTANVAWTRNRDTPYVPSMLLYDDSLYFLKHYQGLLTCVKAKTGEPVYALQRLPEIFNVYASLVGAAGRVYITSREGATVVVKHGAAPEILATNTLDDTFSASSAIVGGEMFLRGEKYLYCVAKE